MGGLNLILLAGLILLLFVPVLTNYAAIRP